MNLTRTAIGLRIRALREKLGANGLEFASAIAISNKTLSSYEKGDSYPSIEALGRIVKVTGSSFDWILLGVAMPKVDQEELSAQEYLMLQLFRLAAESDRDLLLRMAELAASSRKKKPVEADDE